MNDMMQPANTSPSGSPQPAQVDIGHVRGLLAKIPDGSVSLETLEQLLRDSNFSNFWSALGQSQREALSSGVSAGLVDKQLLLDIFELEASPSLDFTQGVSERLVRAGIKGIDSLIQSFGPEALVNRYTWEKLRQDDSFNLWYAFASGGAVSFLDINRISSGVMSLRELRSFVEDSGKALTSAVLG